MAIFWQIIEFLSYIEWMLSLILISLQIVIWFSVSRIWRKNRELEAKAKAPITLILRGPTSVPVSERHDYEIPYRPRRDQLSRGELLGILGTYSGRERYDSKGLRPILEDGSLDRVLAGDDLGSADEILVIPWVDDPRTFDNPAGADAP